MTEEDTILLNPTSELKREHRQRLARPSSLDGLTVGLIDNARPRATEFVDRLAELLPARGLRVRRYRKWHCSFPAEPELQRQIAEECDLAVHSMAD